MREPDAKPASLRVLVIGREGQVARALAERAAGRFAVTRLGRPDLDLAHPGDLAPLFAAAKPDAIVNAAAYTAVDAAERESARAFAVNAEGAGAVATAARALGVPLIHLSTDYVFDGSVARALVESDATGPLNVYGVSKLAGERAVAQAGGDHAILRVSWIYGPHGDNFLRKMLTLARNRPIVNVVDDQFGLPMSSLDLADAILTIAGNLVARPHAPRLRGLFHVAAEGEAISWADFAQAIFDSAASHGGPIARVERVPSSAFPSVARRPAWSWLDASLLKDVHGVALRPWRESLDEVLSRLARDGDWT